MSTPTPIATPTPAGIATPQPTARNAAVSPWQPQPRLDQRAVWWMSYHERFLATIRPARPTILFIGDSITQYWLTTGKATWQADYAPSGAFNLGVAGDTTQYVLWRIGHGELDGISPKLAVLLIGTNDIRAWLPADVAHGVQAVVAAIEAKLPRTQILLLGILPRDPGPDSPIRMRVVATNAILAKTRFGRNVHYLDVGSHLLAPDGTLSLAVMSGDTRLHPTAKGYAIWAAAMDPTLNTLLKTPAPTASTISTPTPAASATATATATVTATPSSAG